MKKYKLISISLLAVWLCSCKNERTANKKLPLSQISRDSVIKEAKNKENTIDSEFILTADSEGKAELNENIPASGKPHQAKKEIDTLTELKSLLRPNNIIELGKMYTDTVHYHNFNDAYDYWMFQVTKNNHIVSLIYTTTEIPKYQKGDEVEIKWKLDSVKQAGDPEFGVFKPFLVSSRTIK